MFVARIKYNSIKLLVFIFLILCVRIFSQDLQFVNFTTQDGLSNNKVNSILQDKYGFIWIGTEDGLNRYDGYQFKIFRNVKQDSNSISDNNIWTLYEDKSGNIWVGTKDGYINKYDQKKNAFTRWNLQSKETNENGITAIYADNKNNIWAGTYQSGLYRINLFTNKTEHWYYNAEESKSLSNNYVTSIACDSSGYLWVSTYSGLNKTNLNAKTQIFEKIYHRNNDLNSLPANLVWYVFNSQLNPGLVWVCTADGFASYNQDKNNFKTFIISSDKKYQFGNSVSSLIEETDNRDTILWVGTYSGLVRINKRNNNTQRFLKEENRPGSLVSNQINHIIKDRSGVVWIATENGLSKMSSKSLRFNNHFSSETDTKLFSALYGKSVKAITKDLRGKIYFGTENGIISFDPLYENTIRNLIQTNGLNVWSLLSDNNNNLWIGTYGQGLKFLDVNSGILRNINIDSPTFKTSAYNYIKSLQQDGDNILIGFWGGGFASLNIKNGDYKIWISDSDNPYSVSYNDVWSILKDSKNRIWVGTDGGGLDLFENSGGGKFFRPEFTLNGTPATASKSIYALCEAKNYSTGNKKNKEVLWIGTNIGLGKILIDNNNDFALMKFELKTYVPGNGLTGNSVKNIIEDGNGNLWLSTSTGISFFNVKEENFVNYSYADGIIGEGFNSGSAVVSDDNTMYFGNLGGINFFNPAQIKISDYKPPVFISDFRIFNEDVKIEDDSPLKENIFKAKRLNLSYSQNVFSFQLAALDYNFPQTTQYAYKMEGFDKNWIYSGDRRYITYTNLGSGSYVFKFKATNSDGVWNEDYNSIAISISPPWWRTPWAYLFYVLLIISGLYILRRIEINRAKLRNDLEMKEFEAKKQRELEAMKSRFFANLSHEFRTPLTLIRGPIEELINKKAGENEQEYYNIIYRNSEKLQKLIDQLLELTRLENAVIPLKAKKENLVKILRGIFFSFESIVKSKSIKMSFISYTDSVFCWIDKDKLEKIINNLLSNAIKFTPENGTITFEINNKKINLDEFAEIIVRDNGIGITEDKLEKIFDRFYQVDDSSNRNFSGSGIGLALVKELVDLHKWQITVKSEQGKGTEFLLLIPLSDSYLKTSEKEIELAKTSGELSAEDTSSKIKPSFTEEEIEHEIAETSKLLTDKPLILIVEDSEDVRGYLKSLLMNEYRLSEAVNGEEGLKKSAEILPDLIVSDVMMPLMDGMEFCKSIKTDLRTSHIPVILLTAKASPESKLEGLETGADDYLTKPFSSKELFVRIKNLLNQRKHLREKFSKEIKVDISSVAATSLDNEFLSKVIEVAEKNISNADFNTETFASEMFLSRSQFHRKLIALTGQGPGEFLRTIRLKRAAALILEKKLSVTQIAFEVGFNSPSHFAKAFRQLFNCLPTEFTGKVVS